MNKNRPHARSDTRDSAWDDGETSRHSGDGRPNDELTRLLPNRLDSTPYLSPDVPAVSPYNLWTIRIVRLVTVAFACATFLWWVLLLISLFITPPGLHVRGSPFFAFGYASVALSMLAIELLFFAVPSRSARLLGMTSAVLLLVDTIIITAVSRTRHEEAWVGTASVIWTAVVAIWAVVADRTVQWGKSEEEERLSGRPETRRTLWEWSSVLLSSIALGALAPAVFLMTCTLTLRALDSRLAPPGERYSVDGDKYQIHVYCRGDKASAVGNGTSATVLIEGGEDPAEWGLWQLADDALDNGFISRYCFADRPGLGWSDTAPSPLPISMASDALSEALSRAGEEGPWVLASAGVGSLYSRVFSSRHSREVKAILMIDPLHEDLLPRIGNPGRGFLLWFQGVISPLGLHRTLGALLRGRSAADRVWGRASYQSGSTIFAKLQESLVANSLSKRDVAASRAIQDKDTPVVLISSGDKMRRDHEWEAKQRDLSHLTTNLQAWDVVDKAPHQVWRTPEGRALIEKRLRKLVRITEAIVT